MNTEEALAALVEADPERTYCVQTCSWANVPRLADHPHSRTDDVTVFCVPGIADKKCSTFYGASIHEAANHAIEAIQQEAALAV